MHLKQGKTTVCFSPGNGCLGRNGEERLTILGCNSKFVGSACDPCCIQRPIIFSAEISVYEYVLEASRTQANNLL